MHEVRNVKDKRKKRKKERKENSTLLQGKTLATVSF